MKRPWPRLLVFFFSATLAVVGVQTVRPFVSQGPKLNDGTAEPPLDWTWDNFRRGDLARAMDDWFNLHLGLRKFWAGLDNQVSYTFFGEVNPRVKGTQIITGAHDWLFEYQYIYTAVQRSEYTDADIAARVARLHAVQEKLARRGIPLLVIVAPSKAELYPEHVPAVYFGGRNPAAVDSNFERARPLLEAAGINFYDGPRRFAALKAAGERNLFARSGTHWSYLAAVRVLQEMRERLNPAMRHPLPEFKVATTRTGAPRLLDRDLLDGINLLVDKPYQHDLPYPELKPQAEVPAAQLPRILWVHDSFGWMLIDLLYAANAARPSESLYYFGKYNPYTVHLPSMANSDVEIEKINWEEHLKSYDAVVIVWTEIAFDHEAWGFIKKLDESLN